MKLILIDKQDIATIAREEVLRDRFHFTVDYALTFEEFNAKYAVGKYHTVIVDFAMDAGAKALAHIDKVDPKQRVVVISASEAYSEPLGCDYCVKHYNRRRLKKPFGVMELADLIRDFDETACAFYHQ